MTDAADASAARPLPETLIEIAYRPRPAPRPDDPLRHTLAGWTAEQAVDLMAATLGLPAARLTARAEADEVRRCWITEGPDGPRLARLAGLTAAEVNLALAAVDAGTFERIAA